MNKPTRNRTRPSPNPPRPDDFRALGTTGSGRMAVMAVMMERRFAVLTEPIERVEKRMGKLQVVCDICLNMTDREDAIEVTANRIPLDSGLMFGDYALLYFCKTCGVEFVDSMEIALQRLIDKHASE